MDGWAIFTLSFFGALTLLTVIFMVIKLIKHKWEVWPAFLGICWAAVLIGAFFYIGLALKWGGCSAKNTPNAVKCQKAKQCQPDPWGDECNTRCPGVPEGSFCPDGERPVFDFCEKFASHGMIKQPKSTWSDLAFIIAGIWILYFIYLFKKEPAQNPMLSVGLLSVTYGMIVIFMGPASMIMHASMKMWASGLDFMSVIIWLSFNAAYVFYLATWACIDKGRGWGRTAAVLMITAVLVLIIGLLEANLQNVKNLHIIIYITVSILWVFAEIFFFCRSRLSKKAKYRRSIPIFIVYVIILGITMTVWGFFLPVNAALCQKVESFPGHAFFHFLSALAALFVFWSFATEKRIV